MLDIETTGGDRNSDLITEIGMVKVRAGEFLGTLQTLVNPGRVIPPMITMLTGTWPHRHGVRDTFVTPEQTRLHAQGIYRGIGGVGIGLGQTQQRHRLGGRIEESEPVRTRRSTGERSARPHAGSIHNLERR